MLASAFAYSSPLFFIGVLWIGYLWGRHDGREEGEQRSEEQWQEWLREHRK